MFGLETLLPTVIGAGASIFGNIMGGQAQSRATQQALQMQQQGREHASNLLSPFIARGRDMLEPLSNFINPEESGSGLNTLMRLIAPGADQNALLEQTPGYQFTRDQGLRAVQNMLATRGHAASPGAVSKGAANYVTGLAGTTWKDVVDRLQTAFTQGAGAMQNFAGMGAGAANNLASIFNQSTNASANNITGLGNAQAGMWTGIGNSLQGLGGNVSQLAMLRGLGMGGGGGGVYGSGAPMGWDTGGMGQGFTYPSFG